MRLPRVRKRERTAVVSDVIRPRYSEAMTEPPVNNNTVANQFELATNGKTSVLQYRLKPGRIIFLHTEVPAELRGSGIASKLAKAGLEFAQSQRLEVAPLCPFVAEYIRRKPEYLDLVAAEYRARLSSE